MSSVHRALRYGHTLASRYAPTQVTVHKLAYASADDPFDTTAQHTSTAYRVRGTFSPQTTTHEPVENYGTHGAIVTLNRASLGFTPSQWDRIEVGGVYYNIVEVHNIEDAVVKLHVRGPAADPVETGDVTAPIVTNIVLASNDPGTFTYTATINESSVWRIRYRRPPLTGSWVTGSYNATPGTAASGTVSGLQGNSTYEFEIQARDVAGNVSRWFAGGNIYVLPGISE